MDVLLISLALLGDAAPPSETPARWAAMKQVARYTGIWEKETGWGLWLNEFAWMRSRMRTLWVGGKYASRLPGIASSESAYRLAEDWYHLCRRSLADATWLTAYGGVDKSGDIAWWKDHQRDACARYDWWSRLINSYREKQYSGFRALVEEMDRDWGGFPPPAVPMECFQDVP